jgi:hypothetical protein
MRATNFAHRIILQLITKIIGLRMEIIKVVIISKAIHTVTTPEQCTRGAGKSLARPGRKQATATKL